MEKDMSQSINDTTIIKERLEFLKIAREMVNNEYLKKRTDLHRQWQIDSHDQWVTKGILLPYPQGFSYPTEQEIVDKALELYNNKYSTKVDSARIESTADTSQPNTDKNIVDVLKETSKVNKEITIPKQEPTPWEIYLNPKDDTLSLSSSKEDAPDLEASMAQDPKDLKEEIIDDKKELTDDIVVKHTSVLKNLLAKFVSTAEKLDSDISKKDNDQ